MIPVGLNIWSRFVSEAFPYLDEAVGGFDSLWLPDHVQYGDNPVAEGWSMMAYALARYPDKLCGHEVLCNSFRNPAHLAKMAATLQTVSGGNVVLGIGAGWNEEEYLAYGWPFPSARVRIEQLAEAIQIIKAMWSEGAATFAGKYYQLANAYCEPVPDPVPPIMIGGAGERYLLRVVAQYADWWNYVYKNRDTYAHKQEVLKSHCSHVGRDYDSILQVIHLGILIGETEQDVERLKAAPGVRPIAENEIAGTPEQVTEILLGAVEQGTQRINVHFCDAPRLEGTQLFAAEVIPHLAH